MRKALYGSDGERLGLVDFVERQSPDFKKWAVSPICSGCGETVHPVNIKAVLGFREASQNLLLRTAQKHRSTLEPHFSHYDGGGQGCPYSMANDPFFAPFKDSPFDYREEQKIYAVLMRESAFNGKIFDQLYRTISHGGTLSREKKKSLWEHTRKIMCRMSLLAHESWVYPFAQILLMGPIDYTFKKSGKQAKLLFKPEGEQTFTFLNLGKHKTCATIPAEIHLSFVNERKGRITYNKYERNGKAVGYTVSKETAVKLGS